MNSLKDFLETFMSNVKFIKQYPHEGMRKRVLSNVYHSTLIGDIKSGYDVIYTKDAGSKIDNIKTNEVEGYFAKFNTVDGHVDVTRENAYKNAIDNFNDSSNPRRVKLLLNHKQSDIDSIIGNVVEMKADEYGGYFKAELYAESKHYQSVVDRLKTNDLEVSYGFRAKGLPEMKEDSDGEYYKEITNVEEIVEISLVTLGASKYGMVFFKEPTVEKKDIINLEEIKKLF